MIDFRISTALLIASAAVPCTAQERAVVASAAKVVVAPKTVLEGPAAKIAFRSGKIVGVGNEIPRDLLDNAKQLTFEGATIVPGFIVTHDYLGIRNDLGETIDAFTPALEAADAFDPFDETLHRHAIGGVTAIGLAPSSDNTLAGLGAVVNWGPDGGDILRDTTYLKVAMVSESLKRDRYPTSRMGAADLVRQRLKAVSTALAPRDLDHRTLADVLSGSRKAAIHARTFAEITEALDLCDEFELQPIVLGGDEAIECIDRLRRTNASVALSPIDFDDKPKQLELAGKLEQAGIAFSFFASHPVELRRSAALAVRHGLSREGALAALTRSAADQLGVADTVGSLRVSFRADFAVYDGDPIDLTSPLQAVFVGGQRVPEQEEKDR